VAPDAGADSVTVEPPPLVMEEWVPGLSVEACQGPVNAVPLPALRVANAALMAELLASGSLSVPAVPVPGAGGDHLRRRVRGAARAGDKLRGNVARGQRIGAGIPASAARDRAVQRHAAPPPAAAMPRRTRRPLRSVAASHAGQGAADSLVEG
jgi:hypothetical protein